ncbi:hypothetical protein ACH35V_28540 [Actinomadura sp. 1N219]|uniref:hypothetical protein n=1 Tax=Actinomadura sp. 1N219 TaxID=3375152 RepID=UPI0037981B39
MSDIAKQNFLAAAAAKGDPDGRTEKFREALLAFGSSTEDNLAAAERVAFKTLPRFGGTQTELALRSADVFLSEVTNFAEETEIPDSIRNEFPEMDQKDWEAVMRVATLVFIALKS